MNFQTILEELDRLYEEEATKVATEEPVEDEKEDEKLTESAEDTDDEEVEIIDDEEVEDVDGDTATEAEEPVVEEPVVEEPQLVLECANCGAVIVLAEADTKVDEAADLVNVGEACQYCEATDGYRVLGVLSPYMTEEVEAEEAPVEDASAEEEPVEDEVVED